jgi:hypothetical protein
VPPLPPRCPVPVHGSVPTFLRLSFLSFCLRFFFWPLVSRPGCTTLGTTPPSSLWAPSSTGTGAAAAVLTLAVARKGSVGRCACASGGCGAPPPPSGAGALSRRRD